MPAPHCAHCSTRQESGMPTFHYVDRSKYRAKLRAALRCHPSAAGPSPRLCHDCFNQFCTGIRKGLKAIMVKSRIRGGGKGVIALQRLEPGEEVTDYSGAPLTRHTDEPHLFDGNHSHQRTNGPQVIEALLAPIKYGGGGRAGYINRACAHGAACRCHPRLPTCDLKNNCTIVSTFDEKQARWRTFSRVLKSTKKEGGRAIEPGEELLQAYKNGQSNPPHPTSARTGRPRKKPRPLQLTAAYRLTLLPKLQAERFRVPTTRLVDEQQQQQVDEFRLVE